MKYSDVSSPYIKAKIACTAFQDRGYINDLIRLGRWIRSPPGGCYGNQAYDLLCMRYPDEYIGLVREARGDAAAVEEQLRVEETARCRSHALRELQQAEAESLHQEKEDWIAAGGIAPEKP